LEGRVQPAVRDREGRVPDQVELGRVADHDRIAGEVRQQPWVLPAAQRDHQLKVLAGARLSYHPEGAKDADLDRPHQGVGQWAAAVDPLPGEVHWRSTFCIGPGAGVMEGGWQAPARQLQGGRKLRDLSQPREQIIKTLDGAKPPRSALFVDCAYEPREGQL